MFLVYHVDFFLTDETVIKEEPMTPMSASSIGEGVSTEVKPPIPEPIQSTAGGDKKRKCCKYGEISIKLLKHSGFFTYHQV